MKIALKTFFLSLIIVLLSSSCSKEDNPSSNDPYEGFLILQTLEMQDYNLEIYSKEGELKTGYNQIVFYIERSGTPINGLTPTWSHVMDMGDFKHSGPRSKIQAIAGNDGFYEGYLVFQMTGMDGSGWSLDVHLNAENKASTDLLVHQDDDRSVITFKGSDLSNYVLYTIEPQSPIIGNNNFVVGLNKMENMMNFPKVENYTIKQDPRMPSMENHSSPNNTDLIYQAETGLYQGNLSLTMSGYWTLNLMVFDTQNNWIKGTEVTEDEYYSEIYLDLEF